MKKMISIIASLALCAGTMTAIPFTASANMIIFTGNSFDSAYERDIELEEYLETNKKIYKSKNLNAHGTYSYLYSEGAGIYGDFVFYTAEFILSEEECTVLSAFLSGNHPEVTINTYVRKTQTVDGVETVINDVELGFGDDISEDMQFEILKEIKSATGFTCQYLYLMSTVNAEILGDVNSDNVVTASDAAMVLSYYAQGQTSTAPASAEGEADYSLIADYNNDGAVTAVDAALILSDYAEGQIS